MPPIPSPDMRISSSKPPPPALPPGSGPVKITVTSAPMDNEEEPSQSDKRRSSTLSSAPAVANLTINEKAGPTARMSRKIELKKDNHNYEVARDYTADMKKYQGRYTLDTMTDLRKKDNFAKKTYFKKKADLKDQMYVFQRVSIVFHNSHSHIEIRNPFRDR
jgi:hypothetical protein